MKEKKRRWNQIDPGKKRFAALAVALLLMAAGCVTYVVFEGNTFTDCLIWYTNEFISDDDISISVKDENVVKAERIYMNSDHHICVDYRSVNPGNTTATIRINQNIADVPPEDSVQELEENIHVDKFGTVFNKSTLNFDGFLFVEIVIITGFVLIFLTSAVTFFEFFKKGRFTYSMVACGGIAVFTLFAILLALYKMRWLNTFRNFLFDISDSGYEFALLTSPFVLILATAIAISNLWLMRHEGFRPQNALGIALAVVWFFGVGMIFWVYDIIIGDNLTSVTRYILARRISYSIAYVISFMECMLLSTIVSAFLSAKYKPPYDKDYIIILGCCIRADGTLTPILRGRVDAAINFEREQHAKTGKHAKFIPSGGQGADEVISESEAMRRYLLEQGYNDEQIIKEDKSVNTDQNIQFSRDKILADGRTLDEVKSGVATTNYHIFRAYILARKHGLDAQGISAKTKWYFYPNAFLREFAGLLFDKKWFIIASVILLLLLYTLGIQFLSLD